MDKRFDEAVRYATMQATTQNSILVWLITLSVLSLIGCAIFAASGRSDRYRDNDREFVALMVALCIGCALIPFVCMYFDNRILLRDPVGYVAHERETKSVVTKD